MRMSSVPSSTRVTWVLSGCTCTVDGCPGRILPIARLNAPNSSGSRPLLTSFAFRNGESQVVSGTCNQSMAVKTCCMACSSSSADWTSLEPGSRRSQLSAPRAGGGDPHPDERETAERHDATEGDQCDHERAHAVVGGRGERGGLRGRGRRRDGGCG